MEISKELRDQIRAVPDAKQLSDLCIENNLHKVQANFEFRFLIHPVDNYSNQVLSPYFCAACGSSAAPQMPEWEHCKACTEKLMTECDDFKVTPEAARKAHFNGPVWLAAYFKPYPN